MPSPVMADRPLAAPRANPVWSMIKLPFRIVIGVLKLVLSLLGLIFTGLGTSLRWLASRRAQSVPAMGTAIPPVPVVPPPAAPVPPSPSIPVARSAAAIPDSRRPKSRTGSRALFVLIVVAMVAGMISYSNDRREATREISAPPRPAPMSRMHSSKLQEYASENAIVGGAIAGFEALAEEAGVDDARPGKDSGDGPAPPTPPTPPTPPVPPQQTRKEATMVISTRRTESNPLIRPAIRITNIRSESPHVTREQAINDAVLQAQAKLAEQLRALPSPIEETPDLAYVRRLVPNESIVEIKPSKEQQELWREAELDPNRVWVELDVEMSSEQLREFRAEHRIESAGKLMAIPLILAAILFGFLRIDAWTKGYLTTALGAGAVILALAAVASAFVIH